MTGETITRRKPQGLLWIACLLGAAALLAAHFVVPHNHFALGALLPLVFGVALFLTRTRPFSIRLDEEGIEVIGPKKSFVRFDRMEALCVYGEERDTRTSFIFAVLHVDGAILVPRDLTVRSDELFEYLRGRIPDRPRFRIPPVLRRYHREQHDLFGEDRVFTYRAIPQVAPSSGMFGILCSIMLIAVGIFWSEWAAEDKRYSDWRAVGGFAIFVGLVWLVVALVTRIRSREKRGSASGNGGLVISPTGIALQQGEMKGQMRWEELTGLTLKPGQGIQLQFAGGSLVIRDIFDTPAREICGQLRSYWRGAAYSSRE